MRVRNPKSLLHHPVPLSQQIKFRFLLPNQKHDAHETTI